MFEKRSTKKKILLTALIGVFIYFGSSVHFAIQLLEKAESGISATKKSQEHQWIRSKKARQDMVAQLESLHETCHYYGLMDCSMRAITATAGILSINPNRKSLLQAKYYYLIAIEEAKTMTSNPEMDPKGKLDQGDPLSVAYYNYYQFCDSFESQMKPKNKEGQIAKKRALIEKRIRRKKEREIALAQKESELAAKKLRNEEKLAKLKEKRLRREQRLAQIAEKKLTLEKRLAEKKKKSQDKARKAALAEKEAILRDIAALERKRNSQKKALEAARRKTEQTLARLKKQKREQAKAARKARERQKLLAMKKKKAEEQSQWDALEDMHEIDEAETEIQIAAQSDVSSRGLQRSNRKAVLDNRGRVQLTSLERRLDGGEDDLAKTEAASVDPEVQAMTRKRARRAAKIISRIGR